MQDYFGFILGLGLIATLSVLVIGIVSFGVHGQFYVRHSNLLMRLRVIFQGITVAALAIGVWLAAS